MAPLLFVRAARLTLGKYIRRCVTVHLAAGELCSLFGVSQWYLHRFVCGIASQSDDSVHHGAHA